MKYLSYVFLALTITINCFAQEQNDANSSEKGKTSAMSTPKIGDHFIDFAQPNTQGKIINLSDFKGKVVLLEFWGSWCKPCRAQHPHLVNTYKEFKDKGFEILGVAAEGSKEDWLKAINEDSLIWENVTDLKAVRNEAVLLYGVTYYPFNFLIDRNGVIISMFIYGSDLTNKLHEILD